uniref:uncharacterized protein LOC122606220 n=1 Tax=Erigeron canadensis TaxID=72917 RepID=UPI001CB9B154|nr:uncharacterized protein LOC122606220 [Erigeron canadensis]
MPNYAKFLKDLISDRKKLEEGKTEVMCAEVSAIIKNEIPPKLEDTWSFLISCSFGIKLYKALADLGANINLMPYLVYKKLSLGELTPTRMSIRLADRSFQYPMGIAKNLQIKVGHMIFLVDFVILEMELDVNVPLILGRPFLMIADAIIRVKAKEISLGVGDDRVLFNVDRALKHPYSCDESCFRLDVVEEEDALEKEDMGDGQALLACNEEEREMVDEMMQEIMALSVDETPPEDESFQEIEVDRSKRVLTSVECAPTDLELKPLPNHLEYAYLEGTSFLPVVISSSLMEDEKSRLITVLKAHKRAFPWKVSDIPGISPEFCKHTINFVDNVKPVVQRQRN